MAEGREETNMLGINFSSRKDGNCGDFLLFLKQQTKTRFVVKWIHDFPFDGCGPCSYECTHGSCPKKDGFAELTAWLDREEAYVFVIPVYNGNLPSAFYRMLERLSPRLHEEAEERRFWKKVRILLIGNPGHGLERSSGILKELFRNAGQVPGIITFSSTDYGMKSTRDRLIEEKEVRKKLRKAAEEEEQEGMPQGT